jgi:hypothetical protein
VELELISADKLAVAGRSLAVCFLEPHSHLCFFLFFDGWWTLAQMPTLKRRTLDSEYKVYSIYMKLYRIYMDLYTFR